MTKKRLDPAEAPALAAIVAAYGEWCSATERLRGALARIGTGVAENEVMAFAKMTADVRGLRMIGYALGWEGCRKAMRGESNSEALP